MASSGKGTPWESLSAKLSLDKTEGRGVHYTFFGLTRTLAKFWEFTVTWPNKQDCGQCIDNSSDIVAEQMVAEFVNIDHQTKLLADAATLTTLQ